MLKEITSETTLYEYIRSRENGKAISNILDDKIDRDNLDNDLRIMEDLSELSVLPARKDLGNEDLYYILYMYHMIYGCLLHSKVMILENKNEKI